MKDCGKKTKLTATAALQRLKLARSYLQACLETIAAIEELNPARAQELRRELKHRLLQILKII
ncbi:MAG: hypothetical protein AB1426_05045 [Bacillota bacterium]